MDTLISFISEIYKNFGIESANAGDVWGIISVMLITFSATSFLLRRTDVAQTEVKLPKKATDLPEKEFQTTVEDVQILEEKTELKEVLPLEKGVVEPTWRERLTKGLARSRSEVWGKLENIFSGEKLSDDVLDEVEEILYTADIGPSTAGDIIEELRKRAKEPNFDSAQFKIFLRDFLGAILSGPQEKLDQSLLTFDSSNAGKTKVIMVVGVNGAGKTTTIGKLATKLTHQGAKVVVGACDTFRAAAVDQLAVWCERAGAHMVRAKEGANPSGVGYQALEEAINMNADYCILDTAGRLHTKGNLMDELAKSKNVLKKLDETAPHQTLLVIDAITGQNALRQAEEFNQTLGLTGLIFTKCDGSSKAGSAVGIVKNLNVPIAYIGVGEKVEDLNHFKVDEYLDSLLQIS